MYTVAGLLDVHARTHRSLAKAGYLIKNGLSVLGRRVVRINEDGEKFRWLAHALDSACSRTLAQSRP